MRVQMLQTLTSSAAEVGRRQFLVERPRMPAGVAVGMVGTGRALAASAGPHRCAAPVRTGPRGDGGVRNQGKVLSAGLASLSDVEVVHAALAATSTKACGRPAVRAVADVTSRVPRWGIDFRRLLDDRTIDAVVIATPATGTRFVYSWRATPFAKTFTSKSPSRAQCPPKANKWSRPRRHSRVVQSGPAAARRHLFRRPSTL